MSPATLSGQRSAPDDAREGVDRDTVLLLAAGIDHGPACGERIPCPVCGEPFGEHYLPAERQVRRGGVFLFCNACHGAWREVAA